MKQYSLGPNGGILTSLNLFATRFDQVRDHLLLQEAFFVPSVYVTASCSYTFRQIRSQSERDTASIDEP